MSENNIIGNLELPLKKGTFTAFPVYNIEENVNSLVYVPCDDINNFQYVLFGTNKRCRKIEGSEVFGLKKYRTIEKKRCELLRCDDLMALSCDILKIHEEYLAKKQEKKLKVAESGCDYTSAAQVIKKRVVKSKMEDTEPINLESVSKEENKRVIDSVLGSVNQVKNLLCLYKGWRSGRLKLPNTGSPGTIAMSVKRLKDNFPELRINFIHSGDRFLDIGDKSVEDIISILDDYSLNLSERLS